MSLVSELESLHGEELIDNLSVQIYSPPLCLARDRYREIAEPLQVVILVLDFDTEVNMNGLLGFLHNSTGLFLSETIGAFEKIGASETVSVLRNVNGVLKRHGITTSRLRDECADSQEFQITTFRELHGDLGTFPNEINELDRKLYLSTGYEEQVRKLLSNYVEVNRNEVLAEIDRITKTTDATC